MKLRQHLIPTAALLVTAAVFAGVAMSSAAQQEKPPAAPTTPAPTAPPGAAPEMPPMPPAPGEHHKWLQQLVGNWTVESEMIPPGMDAIKATGTDTVRSIGGRWIVSELKSDIPGMGLLHAVSALGYDSEKGKYHGTWVDSIQDHLWVYSGTLDPTGKILTLETEGPSMSGEGTTTYRDVIEIKSADHRTLTSSALADGTWVQFGIMNYRRTK